MSRAPKAKTLGKASFGGKVRTVRTDAAGCRMFATCRNDAELRVEHLILGLVPTCKRCADVLRWPENERRPL